MDNNLIIDRLAVHFVDRKNNKLEIAQTEQNVQSLDQVV